MTSYRIPFGVREPGEWTCTAVRPDDYDTRYVKPADVMDWLEKTLGDPLVIGVEIDFYSWPQPDRSLEFWAEDADLFLPLMPELLERWKEPADG